MISKSLLAVTALLSAVLVGCGGGGGGGSNPAGNTSSNVVSNDVAIGSPTVRAGEGTLVSARALVQDAAPTSMTWSITPAGATNAGDLSPVLADASCVTANLIPPQSAGGAGQGSCQTMVNIPPKTKSGTWRITNTVSSKNGSASNSVLLTVTALPASGFTLVESTIPTTGYINNPLTLTAPFIVSPGANVKNVVYTWKASSTNPSVVAITGAKNSSPTIFPNTAGQYSFDVTATADINGFSETSTGTVLALIRGGTIIDRISAGDVQSVGAGDIVKLSGTINNPNTQAQYIENWVASPDNPANTVLTNANTGSASFVAPIPGRYSFEYQVTKILQDGSRNISAAQTQIIVRADSVGTFNVSSGVIQTAAIDTVVSLTGNVDAQGSQSTGTTYSYSWKQIGSLPAVIRLSNASNLIASFIPKIPGTYTFELSVLATKGGVSTTVSAQSQVIVSAVAPPPPAPTDTSTFTVNSGLSQSVVANAVVTLTGSVNPRGTPPAGTTYAYRWRQIGSLPAVTTLSNASGLIASFIPTVAGTYTFELAVTETKNGETTTSTSQSQVVVR